MASEALMDEARLTELETSAAVEAMSTSEGDRDRIRGLLATLEVSHRTVTDYGHYVDVVKGGPSLTDRAGQPLHGVFESSAVHPDGRNAILFVAYLTEGVVEFFEFSASKVWSQDMGCAAFERFD